MSKAKTVKIMYLDKRFNNKKVYTASEVIVPEHWTPYYIRDWFYQRHKYLCDYTGICVVTTRNLTDEDGNDYIHKEYFPETIG